MLHCGNGCVYNSKYEHYLLASEVWGNTCSQGKTLYSEHGDSKFFQNIAVCLPKYVAVFFEYIYLGC